MDEACLRLGFRRGAWASLEADVRARLLAYGADLLRFNRSQNLVSRVDPVAEVARLIEESVCAALALEAAPVGRWMDLGSGGGIPGMVLACVHPSRAIDLVERRQGRCDFLRREVRALDLALARVLQTDVVELHGSAAYALVCAKAVAEPGVVEGLCDPVIIEGGSLVLFQRAGWLSVGDVSPGGWRVEESWPGLCEDEVRVTREGYRLVRT